MTQVMEGQGAALVPRAVFFRCYRCSQPTMNVTVFGVYCQGCGLRSFTDHTEARVVGACAAGHEELVRGSSGARCLVCSFGKEYQQ